MESTESSETVWVLFDMDEFVEKYYQMNPETEDLLLDGSRLENGMKILVEDHRLRAELHHMTPEAGLGEMMEIARRWNRWMTVSEVDFDVEADDVVFIGKYDDGTKKSFKMDAGFSWFVKIDSIAKAVLDVENNVLQNAFGPDTSGWVQRVEDQWKDEKGTSTALTSNQTLAWEELYGSFSSKGPFGFRI